MALVLLALALAGAGWRWGPAAKRHVEMLAAQRRCLNYRAPADQIVFLEDTNSPPWLDAKRLLASDPNFRTFYVTGDNEPIMVGRSATARDQFVPMTTAVTPGTAGGTPKTADTVLFCHQRSAGGMTALVIVSFDKTWIHCRWSNDGSSSYQFHYDVITPGTTFRRPKWIASADHCMGTLRNADGIPPKVRFFAGQPDTNDPARFTIAYDLNQQPGTIEGRLVAGNPPSVSLRILDGPMRDSP